MTKAAYYYFFPSTWLLCFCPDPITRCGKPHKNCIVCCRWWSLHPETPGVSVTVILYNSCRCSGLKLLHVFKQIMTIIFSYFIIWAEIQSEHLSVFSIKAEGYVCMCVYNFLHWMPPKPIAITSTPTTSEKTKNKKPAPILTSSHMALVGCWTLGMPILRYVSCYKIKFCRFRFAVLVKWGNKEWPKCISVSTVLHTVWDRLLTANCKFPHLTVANFLYSLYIYKPNWHIRLATLDPGAGPQGKPTQANKIFVVTFKASRR